MKQLLALAALFLTLGTAHAQTPVTKLPGEENLSLRERAERDFLMPVRRKKEAVRAATPDDATASPENDATAHATASADDARPEEATVATRETHATRSHATRSYAARHAAWLSARRAEARAEERASERRAARHHSSRRSSKATHSSKASHSSKAKSKAARAKEARAAKSSKSHSHSHATKTKTKHKAAAQKVTLHKKPSATKKKATASHKSSKKHRR